MTSSTDPSEAQTLDDLVPVVADVIGHALALQQQADNSVKKVAAAAAEVRTATQGLAETHETLANGIGEVVGDRFNEALNGAGVRIGNKLAEAEKRANTALDQLSSSAQVLTRSMQAEVDGMASRWWLLLGGGFAVGLAIGILGTIVYLRFG